MSYIYIYRQKIDEFNTRAVFVSDYQEKRFVEKREKLESDGFDLLYDSAKTLEHAYQIALANEVYPDYCVNCHTYMETALYRGKRFDFHDGRFYPFNGYLCDGCAEEHDIFEVRFVSPYKPKLMTTS